MKKRYGKWAAGLLLLLCCLIGACCVGYAADEMDEERIFVDETEEVETEEVKTEEEETEEEEVETEEQTQEDEVFHFDQQVTGLLAESTVRGVRLSWTGVEEATGYAIYARYGSTGVNQYMGSVAGTSFIDTRAWEDDYTFYWVYPYYKDPESGIVYMGLAPEHYVYGKRMVFKVNDLKAVSGSAGVTLSWAKTEGAYGYVICGKRGKDGIYQAIGNTTNTTYVDRQAAFLDYTFYWVYPYYKEASGQCIAGQAPDHYVWGCKSLDRVDGLKASSGVTGVTLTWRKVANATGYIICGIRGTEAYTTIGNTQNLTFTDTLASKDGYNFYWVTPYVKLSDGTIKAGYVSASYVYGKRMSQGYAVVGGKLYYYDQGKGNPYTGWYQEHYYTSGRIQSGGYADGYLLSADGTSALRKRIQGLTANYKNLDEQRKIASCFSYVANNYSYRSSYETYANTWNWPQGWTDQFATDMLNQGSGNCYRYASLMAYMLKEATGGKYPIYVYHGTYTGWNQVHGWCTMVGPDGVERVYDPDGYRYLNEKNYFNGMPYSACINTVYTGGVGVRIN